MNKRIIPLLIVLICSLCCLSMVSADNNTTDNMTISETNEDLSNYIIPVYITDNGIEFSDGFTGFCIDSTKATITADDHFTSENIKNDALINHIKLAIIESYKAGKENNLGDIVSQVISGNKEYDVVKAAFNSTETVDETAVVNIDNTTEATFTFELLKPTDDSKSDCLAYKVSLKTVEKDDMLAASNEDANESTTNESTNQSSTSQDTIAESNNTQDTLTKANDTGNQAAGSDDDKNTSNGETIINETNKTIINKTNTVIVNENNTTTINQNNVKVINKTNETPQNATPQQQIMRTVGNPIFILAIVVVVIAVVAVIMRRKN